jgi:hypothetical protein
MPAIDGYSFGRVTIDGREETHDVIVLPERVVRDWWRKEGHGLVLEDLEEVLDDLPERLVVGTGAYGRMRPDPGALETLRARGVDVEVLPTADAVQRYAQLDPKMTAAALHLTRGSRAAPPSAASSACRAASSTVVRTPRGCARSGGMRM